MLEAVDSVGANIAEGYARFHFLEKVRFYYISRASLSEGVEHWIDLGIFSHDANKLLCRHFIYTIIKCLMIIFLELS